MRRPLYKVFVSVAVGAALVLSQTVSTAEPSGARHPAAARSCTMAVPPVRATVEAEIANADDFCELVSHALAVDVFRAPVLVTPGLLWHYAAATLSCRLRYGDTRYRLTIRNSEAACRWLRQLAPGWHLDSTRPSSTHGRDFPNAGPRAASRPRP